jgi:hypothetical protein
MNIINGPRNWAEEVRHACVKTQRAIGPISIRHGNLNAARARVLFWETRFGPRSSACRSTPSVRARLPIRVGAASVVG